MAAGARDSDGVSPAGPRCNLFFALRPPAKVQARAAALAQVVRRTHDLPGRIASGDLQYVTLFFLGNHATVPPKLVADAQAAAASLIAAPFDLSFDQVDSFGSRIRPAIVLRNGADISAWVKFHRLLGIALTRAGLRQWVKSQVPHLALFYTDEVIDACPVEPIGWRVTDFVLVESLVGRSEHRELGRWPLEG